MPISDEGISKALQEDESDMKAQLTAQEAEDKSLEITADELIDHDATPGCAGCEAFMAPHDAPEHRPAHTQECLERCRALRKSKPEANGAEGGLPEARMPMERKFRLLSVN